MAVLPETGPITKTSLAESVYQTLLEAIVGGSLPSGTELSEVALAAELKVSRTPVHEALRRLAGDGFVEIRNNRKARVAHSTRKDLLEMYDVRRLLECAAAECAAGRIDEACLAELRKEADSLAATMQEENWVARAIAFDFRFHEAIAAASGNEHLRDEITRYFLLLRAFRRMISHQDALPEHLAILSALEARDPAAARQSMAAHLEATAQRAMAAHVEEADGRVA
jgi:DNA-binding GntR family transcriptional regulator